MTNVEFDFPTKEEVLKLHEQMIDEFGGSHGLRDEGVLESAINAPQNCYFYEDAGLEICAATYAFHLTQAHALIDGNKRIGHVTAILFLKLNNAELIATQAELIEIFLQIAASELSREDVEQFFISRVKLK